MKHLLKFFCWFYPRPSERLFLPFLKLGKQLTTHNASANEQIKVNAGQVLTQFKQFSLTKEKIRATTGNKWIKKPLRKNLLKIQNSKNQSQNVAFVQMQIFC